MPGLLSWFTAWLDSTSPDSEDQTLSDLNVAINNTIIATRSEMAGLIDQNIAKGAIIKLHYDDCIEQTLRRFLDLTMFSAGDIMSIRQRLVDCDTLKALDVHDNELDAQTVNPSIAQSDEQLSSIADSMLSVFRSWIKLDVLDGDVQQALLIILEELKQSIMKVLIAQVPLVQTSSQPTNRVCIRVPTLNTICVLLFNVESVNQSIRLSYLSSRVTLFDQFSNDNDCQELNEVFAKLQSNKQATFQDAEHRASRLYEIKAEVF
jgi:hypothetical protein